MSGIFSPQGTSAHLFFRATYIHLFFPPIELKKKIYQSNANPSIHHKPRLGRCVLYLPVLHRPHLSVVFLAGERTPQRAENLHEHDHQQHNDELQSLHRHLRVPKYLYIYMLTKKSGSSWSGKNFPDQDAYSSQITSKSRNASSSVLCFVALVLSEGLLCSYRAPVLAPPRLLQVDIKVNISCRPVFFFFLCLTQR